MKWARTLLAVNFVVLLPLAVWPLISPRGFYDEFPGGGFHWIDVNGPYNEHFIRDFGSLNAALLVIVGCAVWKTSPSLVRAAGLALAVGAAPHAVYHLAHTDVYESSEKFIAVGPLVIQVFMGLAITMLPSLSSRDRIPARDRRT
ncbi:MAG TPA: hypothetical protein VM032_03515 [Vicinamibacterales bacterium]|nr:hypothetical protein [Vicinamibacterales bacterium]